jgi:hypothetical protein
MNRAEHQPEPHPEGGAEQGRPGEGRAAEAAEADRVRRPGRTGQPGEQPVPAQRHRHRPGRHRGGGPPPGKEAADQDGRTAVPEKCPLRAHLGRHQPAVAQPAARLAAEQIGHPVAGHATQRDRRGQRDQVRLAGRGHRAQADHQGLDGYDRDEPVDRDRQEDDQVKPRRTDQRHQVGEHVTDRTDHGAAAHWGQYANRGWG